MTDWHLIHLGQLALSGASVLTIEAASVVPEGRITYRDVGLWDDRTEAAMGRVINSIRSWSDMPIAIQLAHAGRKASTDLPWLGGAQLAPGHTNGWQTEAPSPLPFNPTHISPTALDRARLNEIRNAFVSSAKRAVRLGIDAIQLHAAHGYLLHEFLSPLSNARTDEFGGDLEGRASFPLAVFRAVRAAVPHNMPVTVRISGTDWAEGGLDIGQTTAFSRMLELEGCDAIHVSSGGLDINQEIPVSPSYQVPLARAVKNAVNIPVVAVGLITDPQQAEAIVATGDADLVALARTVLYDPRWPWHAAAELGGQVKAPNQYLRCQPQQFKNLFS